MKKYTHILILSTAIALFLGIIFSAWFFVFKDERSYSSIFLNTYRAAVIDSIWVAYRETIQDDGRTIDRGRNYLTTSEGQSYSLLRSVWMDDRDTFDQVLKWTKHNLQKREEDQLFAWLWGQRSDGRWDIIIEEGGRNSASDADQDIALALIFAAVRWNDTYYLDEANEILDDIWRQEVVLIGNRPYLTAGNWARDEIRPTINPSYLSPAWYEIFARVDTEHDWLAVKDTSYEVLNRSTWNELDRGAAVGLPPDWVSIDRTTGAIMPSMHADKTTNFSDDAFRTFWRVGLDWEWHRDERAYEYLTRITFLKDEWEKRGLIYGTYGHDGSLTKTEESSSLYGVLLAYFSIVDPDIAQEIYDKKISKYYDTDTENLKDYLGYYPQNWVWFGMAFYNDRLPNLADPD